jgi:hypothetical protein
VLRQGKRGNVEIFENEGERGVCTVVCFYGRDFAVSISYYSSSKGRIWINQDLSERKSSGFQSMIHINGFFLEITKAKSKSE